MFQHRGLSASLASRLSRGENSFSKPNSKFTSSRQINKYIPSNGLHGRLSLPSLKKKSIHSRLTVGSTGNKQRILQVQSNAFLKSIKAIEEGEKKIRRPIKSLKTRSNSDEFLPVRINNGAVVKGLRSDQLLLKKVRQQEIIALEYKRERHKVLKGKEKHVSEKRVPVLKSSKVSMDFNSGLTISFANDAAKKNRLSKVKPSYSGQSDEISVSSSEDEHPVKRLQRSTYNKTDQAEDIKIPLLRIGMERPPPPKPHRQVLDTKVQKEIAALQGRLDSPHSGPGPGVKNFKMIPNLTKYSLSERFTVERTIVE